MSTEPAINPHYQGGKAEADEWFKELLQLKGKEEKKFNKTDFGFAAAVWAPSAEKDRFRTAVDWSNWIFYFDDQFDEGPLANDPVKAQEEVDCILAILNDSGPRVQADKPLQYAFQAIWDRIKASDTPEVRERWKDSHKKYLEGLLYQSKLSKSSSAPVLTVDQYMSYRRRTIGVVLAIRLVEYAEDIKLSQTQMDHPSLQLCTSTIVDLVVLSNDILSYKKEVELNDAGNNLVTILKAHNLSDQEAMNSIGKMLDDCYEAWHSALDKLPTWGEETDREVLKYLDACRNVGLGNLHWSFRSGRYFGACGEQVRQTRILSLPPY
ncbi:terpene synthase family, metal binding domain-containing protein [Trichoderma breve]|uniref:Terpene synthase n=1 Tax=Trichoderma breve TaxID=2034170 RepID=A0A9W9BCP6_9HYPO|nr:terpene synthase family, metal binding domain-containing protein [Trichoderma breve]KAJ4857156.1 terpene synthase family, metal binding domain-containing protein [Trichoderma breve]